MVTKENPEPPDGQMDKWTDRQQSLYRTLHLQGSIICWVNDDQLTRPTWKVRKVLLARILLAYMRHLQQMFT